MKGKRPLHYGIFLSAGALISGISGYSINFTNTSNKASMKLFFGVGLIFLLIGIIKFIVKKISQISDNEKKFKANMSGIDKINREERNMSKKYNKEGDQKFENPIISCPRCGTNNYRSSNYCHICGLRLKQHKNPKV